MPVSTSTDNIKNSQIPTIVGHLNQAVADCYGLLGQLHLAHWNVEGMNFLPLHEMFQTQYEELFTAIDDIAERTRALGHYSEGGLKRLAGMSRVEEGPSAASATDKEWISSVLVAHETVIATLVEGRKVAAEAGDAETEDLLIGRISTHQKAAWFLKSYLN